VGPIDWTVNVKRQSLWIALGALLLLGTPGWASPFDVPGEQVEGSLLPADDSFSSHRSELSPAELKMLGMDKGALKVAQPLSYDSLPPIYITVEERGYQQVPVTVAVSTTPKIENGRYRRQPLASRSGHAMVAPQISGDSAAPTTRTVYRNVYRVFQKKVDITPIILRQAEKNGVDPWLLRGIIETESAFRPYARSGVGAGGLMQLMPGTASYLGCQDRFNPEQNIAAGAKYIRMMYQRFGDYDLAIAAYNAGPGNVEKFGGIPPFAETQNYVRKVRRAWQWRPSESK
jgi:hypothetical protein